MILPSAVEKTQRGKIKECSVPGTISYCENEQYNLQISVEGDNIVITYMSENCDNTLDDNDMKYIIKNLTSFEI